MSETSTIGDDATTAGDGAVPNSELDAFCKGTLGLYAPRYAACCDPTAAPKQYNFDYTLTKGVGEACSLTLGKSVANGRATFVPAAAATCQASTAAAVAAPTCPEVHRTPRNQSTTRSIFKDAESCGEVLVGKQVADAPCANDYECVDGLTCIGWTTESDGACKTPPGEGALCGYGLKDGGGFLELFQWGFGTHPRCAPGFYCASTVLQQGTCRAKSAATGECDSDDECVDGLRCQLGACGTAGPAAAGESCERNADCQDRMYCKSAEAGRHCSTREVAGTPCSGELSTECQGACVKPDGGGQASCVAYCGSQ